MDEVASEKSVKANDDKAVQVVVAAGRLLHHVPVHADVAAHGDLGAGHWLGLRNAQALCVRKGPCRPAANLAKMVTGTLRRSGNLALGKNASAGTSAVS